MKRKKHKLIMWIMLRFFRKSYYIFPFLLIIFLFSAKTSYAACSVVTTPVRALFVGESDQIEAIITGATSGIHHVEFDIYNPAIASINRNLVSSAPFEITATANAVGLTAVTAKVFLNDNTTCQTTGQTDTDIYVGTTNNKSDPNYCFLSTTPTTTVTKNIGDPPTIVNGAGLYGIGPMWVLQKCFWSDDLNVIGLAPSNNACITKSPYETGFIAKGPGSASVWGAAFIDNDNDGDYDRICITPASMNTDFIVPGTVPTTTPVPSSTPAPTTTPVPTATPTLAPVDQWYQSVGVDMRNDKGFLDILPFPTTYASIIGTGGMPGIVFSGSGSPYFGSLNRYASDPINWGWSVEDLLPNNKLVQTSFEFLHATSERFGMTPISIVVNPADDTIDLPPLPAYAGDVGVFIIDAGGPGNPAIVDNLINIPSGEKYIFLVNGDLYIEQNITVDSGAIVIFSASGDITVDPAVNQIAGLYSADYNFTTKTNGGIDTQLTINGGVIVNAARNTGSFTNDRTLGSGNSADPSVSFNERPDFILNYPDILKRTNRIWQEVAP